MNFKCVYCNKRHKISHKDCIENRQVDTFPWYIDNKGVKHMAIVCKVCGTIHDCIGANILYSILSGFRQLTKVCGYVTINDLKDYVSNRTYNPGHDSMKILTQEFGIPLQAYEIIEEKLSFKEKN